MLGARLLQLLRQALGRVRRRLLGALALGEQPRERRALDVLAVGRRRGVAPVARVRPARVKLLEALKLFFDGGLLPLPRGQQVARAFGFRKERRLARGLRAQGRGATARVVEFAQTLLDFADVFRERLVRARGGGHLLALVPARLALLLDLLEALAQAVPARRSAAPRRAR